SVAWTHHLPKVRLACDTTRTREPSIFCPRSALCSSTGLWTRDGATISQPARKRLSCGTRRGTCFVHCGQTSGSICSTEWWDLYCKTCKTCKRRNCKIILASWSGVVHRLNRNDKTNSKPQTT